MDFFPDAACLTSLARMATGFHDTQEATLLPRNGGMAPVHVVIDRERWSFRGTMTRRTKNNELPPADFLDVSPDDATRLDVHDSDVVRTVSRYGSATLPVRLNTAIQPGHLFATFQRLKYFSTLTGPHRDETTGTPEYKVTAVRIEHHESPSEISHANESRTGSR